MRDFTCPKCGQHLTFEKSRCLSCGSAVGYSYSERTLRVIVHGTDSAHAGAVDDSEYQLCANRFAAKCNWLVKADKGAPAETLCTSCRLTRPNPTPHRESMAAFASAEQAKRRLIARCTS